MPLFNEWLIWKLVVLIPVRSQDEMREQVRGILADYLPLEDQEGAMDFAGGRSTSLVS